MNWKSGIVAAAVALGCIVRLSPAEPFTYQGQLKDSGSPMNGAVDLTFKLFDAASNGNQQGNTLTFNAQPVDNGLFTVSLDFGFNNTLWFPGSPRWLEIAVNGTTLTTRQPVNPTPYALRSLKPWQTALSSGNDISFTSNGFLGLGNVGIGDTSPAATLTVGDGDKFQVSGADGRVKFADGNGGITFPDTTSNSTPMIQLFDLGLTLPTSRMILGHSVNFPLEGLEYSSHEYNFRSASNLALNIDVNTPFVGVNRNSRVTAAEYFGIQAPATGTNFGGMYIQTNATTAKPFYGYSTGSGAGSQRAYSYLDGTTGDWRLNVGGDWLAVTETGDVGIGTLSPGHKLDVNGRARIREGGGSAGLWFYQNTPAADRAFIGMFNDTTVGLYGNSGAGWSLLMNTTSGNFSIGTTAFPAGVKLAVNGKVLCEELEVQLSQDWPDYVFDSGYVLTPLDQLEQTIHLDKHLPGMPSAAEVAEKGVNVGQVQAQTLQKVEELTLYMIEMNKQLEAMKKENADLKARLAAMEDGR